MTHVVESAGVSSMLREPSSVKRAGKKDRVREAAGMGGRERGQGSKTWPWPGYVAGDGQAMCSSEGSSGLQGAETAGERSRGGWGEQLVEAGGSGTCNMYSSAAARQHNRQPGPPPHEPTLIGGAHRPQNCRVHTAEARGSRSGRNTAKLRGGEAARAGCLVGRVTAQRRGGRCAAAAPRDPTHPACRAA